MGRIPIRAVLVCWLFLLSAIAFLDRTNLTVAGLQISREYHLDNVRLGWLLSAFLVGYAGSQVLAGWIAVRLGPRKALTFGVLWWGVFTLATAAVPPNIHGALWLLIAIRLALGVGEAIIYPTSNQFVARWIPVSERGRVNGVIFAGVGAGSMLTPPILTAIILAYGWRYGFWFSAAIGIVAGVGWYVIARDSPEQHPWVSQKERDSIQAGILVGDSSKPPIPWGAIVRSRSMILLTFSCFCFGYVAWIFLGWFFLYMAQARHMDMKSSALYSMIPFAAMTTFCLIGGVLCDGVARRYGLRTGRVVPSFVGLMLCGGLLIAGSHAASAALTAVTLAAGVGALYISQSAYWSVTADIGGRNAGVVSSIMNTGAQVGGAVTTTLTPWLAGRFGWSAGFFAAALFAFAGAFAWLGVNPEIQLSQKSIKSRISQAG
ncbi:MAG: MFS transporter [Acidobacteria bacterium]|nr:MFS transporter [Acidobacteriota bacterium]